MLFACHTQSMTLKQLESFYEFEFRKWWGHVIKDSDNDFETDILPEKKQVRFDLTGAQEVKQSLMKSKRVHCGYCGRSFHSTWLVAQHSRIHQK